MNIDDVVKSDREEYKKALDRINRDETIKYCSVFCNIYLFCYRMLNYGVYYCAQKCMKKFDSNELSDYEKSCGESCFEKYLGTVKRSSRKFSSLLEEDRKTE